MFTEFKHQEMWANPPPGGEKGSGPPNISPGAKRGRRIGPTLHSLSLFLFSVSFLLLWKNDELLPKCISGRRPGRRRNFVGGRPEFGVKEKRIC